MEKPLRLLLIIMIILLFLLTGCTSYSPYYNNFDTRLFYANMKPSLENYGKKAAVYDNRIYYLSAEKGSQGIYSMLLDGTDVKPEFETEDIRSLTVTSDGFYYTGFAHISENANGAYRCFHLLHRESAASNPINLISQAENADLLDGDNVWDFYLKEDGSLYFRIPRMLFFFGLNGLTISTLYNGKILTLPDYNMMLNNLKAFDNPHQQSGLVVYQNKNLLFPLSFEINDGEKIVEIFDDEDVSLFDETKSRTVLPIDAIFLSFSERYDGYYSDRWIIRISDEKILLAYEAGLYEYDMKTDTSREVCAFPKTESIYATYDDGTDILLLTKTFRKEGWIRNRFRKFFQIPKQKGETLYRIDPSTGESTTMLGLDQGDAFLYIDDVTVATASDNMISIYDISGGKAELLRTIQVEHKIVDRANKVDTAGGWLFLYRFNEQTQRDELIEKVFIGS